MNIKECHVILDQSQRRISYVHLCKNTKHACLCRDKIFEVNVKIGCVPKIIVDLLDILWCVFLQILAKLVILIIDPVILIYIVVE